MEELVHYITTMPPEDGNNQFPFVAHEVLKTGAKFILDYFFGVKAVGGGEGEPTSESESTKLEEGSIPEPPELDKILEVKKPSFQKERLDRLLKDFLKSEASLNPVLGGYVQATVATLLHRKRKEFENYFFEDKELMPLLVSRLPSEAMTGLFKNLVLREKVDQEQGSSFDLYAMGEGDEGEGKTQEGPNFMQERIEAIYQAQTAYLKSTDLDFRLNLKGIFQHLLLDISGIESGKQMVEKLFLENSPFLKYLFQDATQKAPSWPVSQGRMLYKASAEVLAELFSFLGSQPPPQEEVQFGFGGGQALKQKNAEMAQVLKTQYLGEDSMCLQAVASGLQGVVEWLGDNSLPKQTSTQGVEIRVFDTQGLELMEILGALERLKIPALDLILNQKNCIGLGMVSENQIGISFGLSLEFYVASKSDAVHSRSVE